MMSYINRVKQVISQPFNSLPSLFQTVCHPYDIIGKPPDGRNIFLWWFLLQSKDSLQGYFHWLPPTGQNIQLRRASKVSITVIFPKAAKHKEDFAKIKNKQKTPTKTKCQYAKPVKRYPCTKRLTWTLYLKIYAPKFGSLIPEWKIFFMDVVKE